MAFKRFAYVAAIAPPYNGMVAQCSCVGGNVAESTGSKPKRYEVYWVLVVGAALHWSSMALALLPIRACAGVQPAFLNETAWLCTALSVPICVAAVALAGLFARRRFRIAVAALGALGSAVALAMVFAAGPGGVESSPFMAVAYQVVQTCSIMPLVLLWGLSFASLDKRSAGANVVMTSTLTAATLLLAVAVSECLPSCEPAIECLSRMASSILLVLPHVPFSIKRRDFDSARRVAFVRFLAVRGIIGIIIGLLASTLVAAGTSWKASLIGALVSVAGLLALSAKRPLPYRLSPLVPLMFVGIFALPVLFGGQDLAATGFGAVGASLCWTCWISTSCFQISGLKETFGVDEARLCFSEKVVLLAGWLVGLITTGSTPLPISLVFGMNEAQIPALLSYSVVLWATYASFRTVYSRREDELIGRLETSRAEHREQVYETLGSRGGLTKREIEVMRMLAQGFTRPHICRELGISDGTARAHAFHVYQKLGVHKKDDLLQLVREVETELDEE